MAELSDDVGRDTAKGRSLRRDPWAVMYVDDPHPPYSFVQVQGTAQISEDPQRVVDTATRVGARYMGPDHAEEFGRRNGVPGELVVRIQPTKVVSAFDLAG
jgi:PPOX class probable F420-dependent enzyme